MDSTCEDGSEDEVAGLKEASKHVERWDDIVAYAFPNKKQLCPSGLQNLGPNN